MPAYAAQASQPDILHACLEVLPHGNAVDAVVAGVLAAAALWPSVLLGPVQMLIGGAGAGERAVDGRPRQPGLGAPRPRGFLPNDGVPGAARVAVPALPAALAAALATSGTLPWARAMGPAVELAKIHSEPRRRLLKRLGQVGPSGLAEAAIAQELIAAGGRVEGGLLTQEDLERVRPEVLAAEQGRGPAPFFVVPWGARAVLEEAPSVDAHGVSAVAAADGRGQVAVACFEVRGEGVAVPELGLEAPPFATPVLRGQPRVRPGAPRTVAAPIALLHTDGTLDTALGLGGLSEAEVLLGELVRAVGRGAPLEEALRAPRGGAEGARRGQVRGVVRTRRDARAFVDGRPG